MIMSRSFTTTHLTCVSQRNLSLLLSSVHDVLLLLMVNRNLIKIKTSFNCQRSMFDIYKLYTIYAMFSSLLIFFITRQEWTSDVLPGDGIRVTSYNILADLYADSDYSRNVLFAQVTSLSNLSHSLLYSYTIWAGNNNCINLHFLFFLVSPVCTLNRLQSQVASDRADWLP